MHSILFYFVLSACFLGFAACLAKTPFGSLSATSARKYASVEGLRGFLALGVFFHHAVIIYYYHTTGIWQNPPVAFYALTGQVGVSIFFMITGFLFWEKALTSKGHVALFAFYMNRLRRLAPAYVVSVILVIAVLALPIDARTLDHLQSRDWNTFLTFRGLKSVGVINSVYWTLFWEWKFYLLFPLLAFCLRSRLGLLPILALIIYSAFHTGTTFAPINFICGGLAAIVLRHPTFLRAAGLPLFHLAATGALIVLFARFDSAFGFAQSFLMWFFFVSVICGNSLFGVLTNKAAELLGTVSYSIYLLHCIVLYAMVTTLHLYLPIASLSSLEYWSFMLIVGCTVIICSTASYRWVEKPFIKASTPKI